MERFKDVDMASLIDRADIVCEHSIGLSETQADAIVQMKLGQLTGLERNKIINELVELYKKIADYKDILANDSRVCTIISEELAEIRRKFNDERRTSIEAITGEVDVEDLIPVEECVITRTNIGYIKRTPIDIYKTQRRGGRGVSGMKQREEDYISELFVASTHDNVLFITNMGRMYKLKGYEIPEGSKNSKGVNYINLLPLQENERVSAMLKVPDFQEDQYIVIATKYGKLKRTKLSEYKNIRKNSLIGVVLEGDDEVIGARLTNGSNSLLLATKLGYAIHVLESDIRNSGRKSMGVRGIRLRPEDEVVSMARTRDGATVLTITENGLGRRCELNHYRLQNRGGYGIKNYHVSEKSGYVCGIKVVDATDDIILISNDGIIIRFTADSVNVASRVAQGVKVMRLSENDKVVAFTRTQPVEEVDDTSETVIDTTTELENSTETEE